MNSRFVLTLLGLAGAVWATPIPVVGSGTMVAHFRASDAKVARDGSGNVTTWTADNNAAIVLTSTGPKPSNIAYSATGMNGAPEIVVNDFAPNDNQFLTGAITGTRTATTIFWLGHYSPGRGGSLGDSAGQYVYSYGTNGADGSQMDHQIDGGVFQLFGGSGTQSGDNIAGFNSIRTVWTTFYGQGTGNAHSAFAGTTNLNVASPNGGNYSASGNLILFGFQATNTSSGFNFVGNIAELIIYDGILSSQDVDAIRGYLQLRAGGDLGEPVTSNVVPEPATWGMMSIALAGVVARRRRR